MNSSTRMMTLKLAALVLLGSLIACNKTGEMAGLAEQAPAAPEALACANEKAAMVPDTGTFSRSIGTDSPQAQAFFDQGLRLTYSYYFPEALASFEAGLCFDADNPMLHWGRALAIAPNPNSRFGGAPDDPVGAGQEAITRAQNNAQDLPKVDRALIGALAVLLDKEAYPDQTERSQAFIEVTQTLVREHPEDLEAAFLAADAIMMASPWNYFSPEDGRPIGYAGEAMSILEAGMEQNPLHPGLNHLHIHLMENSAEPQRAEASADRLEALTPRAGHMVHMPGHIYMRVGRYDDALTTNERSLAADEYFVEQWGDRPLPSGTTYGLSARNHGGHARNFIQWASFMQGNSARAIAEAKSMADAVSSERLSRGASLRSPAVYFMTLRAFGQWDTILDQTLPPESQPYPAGILHGVRGSAYLAQNDIAAAERELEALATAAQSKKAQNQRATVNPVPDLLEIAQLMLRGEIASARGDLDEAVENFQSAVVIQDQLRYMEPPDWMHSTRLYLGQAYLDAGKHEQAEAAFREDLEALQENGWALFGLAQSLEARNKTQQAETTLQRFNSAWSKADVELTAAHF